MDTASPSPYVQANRIGKIEVTVELNGKKYTFKSDVITDFDLTVDYENRTFSDGFMEHSIPDPPIKSVGLSWRPLKNDQNVELTQLIEDLPPNPHEYKDGEVTFPRQDLGGSISRFEDRERLAVLNLEALGIFRVRIEKPHVLGPQHYKCFPRAGKPDYFIVKQGEKVEVKDGKVAVHDRNTGNIRTGWLKLP